MMFLVTGLQGLFSHISMQNAKVKEKLSFKAAVLKELKKPLKLVNGIKALPLERGQILIKLAYSGVCHSQLMEIDGKRGRDDYLPHMLGHEGSGIVLKKHPSVKKLKEGDTVVLTWIKAKGIDAGGAKYISNNDFINAGSVTTFNEYAVVSENRCVKTPKGVPMDIAALFGCAVLTGSGILKNTIKPKKNTSIAFFGLGGIGMSALALNKMYSFKNIFAIDVNNQRLKEAESFGANYLVNPLIDDPVEFIKNETDNEGVDYSIEAAGKTKTIEQAFESVKTKGGLSVFASHPEYGSSIKIDPFQLISGKRILGSWGGGASPDKDIPFYADLYLQGKLDLKKLITKRYKLEDINLAIRDLKKGKVLRPIIEIDKSIKNTSI